MTQEEKEFVKKINIDKASKKLLPTIGLLIISLLTYIFPLMAGVFDFGLIFEIITLVSMLFAKFFMSKYDENAAKISMIISIASYGWIIIYDFFLFLSDPYSPFFIFAYNITLLLEILPIIILFMQFSVYKDLAKADNPEKYKESTDWFYENVHKK